MPDAVVIGGGVMGLAAARALRQRGYSVTLLEQGELAHAASWASAGIFGASTSHSGEAGQPLRDLSHTLWPDFARTIAEESGMDPEYRETGVLTVALDDEQAAEIERRHRAGQTRGSRLADGAAIHELEPTLGPTVLCGLWQPGGNVDNRRLCRALELSIRAAGVEVRTAARVVAVEQQGGHVAGVRLDSQDERIAADLVVLAAGAWSGSIAGVRPVPTIVPQRGQVVCLDRGSVPVRHVVMTLTDPYVVPRADGRVVVGATVEERGDDTTVTAGGVLELLLRAYEALPGISELELIETTAGLRPAAPDNAPIVGIGALEGLVWATAHWRNGILLAPITADAVVSTINSGAVPPELGPFSPARFAEKQPSLEEVAAR
jgi:glycine oxidase